MPVITGTNDDESFTGTNENDHIRGLGGDDILDGAGGDDVLEGGEGDDSIVSGDGADIVDGGAGVDFLHFFRPSSSTADLHIDLSASGPVATGDGGSVVGVEAVSAGGAAGDDVFIGGAFNDNLSGGDGDNFLDGRAGDDRIVDDNLVFGPAGQDTLLGGAGDDVITSNGGADAIDGGAGFDTLHIRRADAIVALHIDLSASSPFDIGDGTEIIGIEQISVFAGSGADVFVGGAFDDTFSGGLGDDDLTGGAGDDRLEGQSGDDTIHGGAGADTLEGESDFFEPNPGNDVIFGDDGDDAIDGGAGTDTLFGGAGADVVFGGDGVNEIHGGEGDDVLGAGFTSSNQIFGEAGNDIIGGQIDGVDLMDGGAGDDEIHHSAGADTLIGGDGIDLIGIFFTTFPLPSPIIFDINDADEGTITLFDGATVTDFERVNISCSDGDDRIDGGAFDDIITARKGNDIVNGGGGADIIRGEGGSDVLDGGAGDDYIEEVDDLENPGVDTISGGDGNDELFVFVDPGDLLDGGAGVDIAHLALFDLNQPITLAIGDTTVAGVTLLNFEIAIFIGTGFDDTLTGGSFGDDLNGSSGNDALTGLEADDILRGGGGNDVLAGGDGADELFGEGISGPVPGDDQISGGAGDDFIQGDGGFDTLDGGEGNDMIVDAQLDLNGTMSGAAGDDILIVANAAGGGVWSIDGGEGFDTLQTEGFLNLHAGVTLSGVERLVHPLFGHFITYEPAQLDGFVEILLNNAFLAPLSAGVTDLSGAAMPAQFFANGFMRTNTFQFEGTNGADTLILPAAGLASVTANGAQGNDTLIGGAANDTLIGGAGVDTLSGGAGDDQFIQTLTGGVDQIFGGAGADTIDYSTASGAVIVQLSGYATTSGTVVATFSGLEGAVGSNFNDAIVGTAGANRIAGLGGNDWLVGGGGDDVFVLDLASGVDTIFGGVSGADSGFDTVDFTFAGRGVIVQLSGGYATSNAGVLLASLSGIEAAIGSFSSDTLIGTAANNRFTGGGGADWIVGGGGDDWFVQGLDHGIDRLFGDAGVDTIDYSGATAGVTVQLTGYAASASVTLATFTGIENAVGSAFDDALIGNAANNRITGGAGSDWLVGMAGDDRFVQGTESGLDRLFGDAGTDTIDYSGAGVAITVQLNGWSAIGGGATLATFTGIENAVGSSFNDALIGNALDNRIEGGQGADWLVGQGGNDTFMQSIDPTSIDRLFGDAGMDAIDYSGASAGVVVQLSGYATVNQIGGATLATFTGIENAIGSNFADALIGNAGANVITGGGGADWLVGGAGADTFVYSALETTRDSIRDFTAEDLIDLSAIDANPTTGVDDAFIFATVRHAGVVGEAVVANFGASSLVSLYLDADNIADMTVQVVHQNGFVMSAGDFVL